MTDIKISRRSTESPVAGATSPHIGWYVLARSEDVAQGAVLGTDFLNGRVVVYRGEDGAVRVIGAYCRHMGADLSLGDVVGNDIRCAFHHWQYGSGGACTVIPAGDKIPSGARLYEFAAAEAFGLIWAYNGEAPTELPSFHGIDASDFFTVLGEPLDFPIEPWMLITNTVDLQHLRVLHGLEIHCDPDDIKMGEHMIEYDLRICDPMLGETEQHFNIFGTNTIMSTVRMGELTFLLCGTATPTPTGCRSWVFAASPRNANGDEVAPEVSMMLEMQLGWISRLRAEDLPVMSTIRFKEDHLLPADRALARFLRYARRFPRENPACEFIT